MSKPRDLYLEAAANAKVPFRRLYLDTEPLRHGNWPFVSKQLQSCLNLAFYMGLEVFIPEAARHERIEQWIRETLAELNAIHGKVGKLQRTISSFITEPLVLQAPSEEQL